MAENGKTYLPRPGVLRGGGSEGVDKKGGTAGGTFCEALHAPPRCVCVSQRGRGKGNGRGMEMFPTRATVDAVRKIWATLW